MTDIVPSFQNVFDGILRNVSRRLRNLRQLYTIIFPLILENLDLRFLRYIPGFRTGKLWKMILAFFGYLSFLYCSMTSDFTNAKNGLPLTGLQLWHERFFVFLMLLSLIFYNFNYKNIRTRSFLGHSLPFVLRIVLQCLISLGILVILMIFMLLIEEIIW